jgi:spermine/spermidine synthase
LRISAVQISNKSAIRNPQSAMTLFLSSFLVLFLEVALIRWMPAYIRLLSYFSNFILLAAFLGCGIGCLLAGARRNLFLLFPSLLVVVVVAVDLLRLEVAVPSATTIYFSSGTSGKVVAVESTMLLPLMFIVVALLFVTVAQRMARELERASRADRGRPARRPATLRAYAINLLGSLAGVGGFALMASLQVPPVAWFGVAFAAALPFLFEGRRPIAIANIALLAFALVLVQRMERGSLWSPYYKINVSQDRDDIIVEVNNIFHQTMAPVDHKEYFYQWPYTAFGDTFDDVLILGAGSGTDVAAALRHGAKHVDAVEIDPVILRLGKERHPDHPYDDPRVTPIVDDARHFLATTTKRYDLVVFALIDSLTVQSSFSGVRLESYMFTEESFRAVRDRLKPHGLMVLYNYFREKWLVDRLANTVAQVFEQEPRVHVHQERAYLAVLLAGPRLSGAISIPPPPAQVMAYGQAHDASPPQPLQRDASIIPATDDWPFLYMRAPELPRHYLAALGIVLAVSAIAVFAVSHPYAVSGFSRTSDAGLSRTLHFFFLGTGFMLLETKSIVQFALLWGATWSSASLAIASVLVMALASAAVASRVEIHRSGPIAAALLGLIVVNYLLPVGRVSFSTRIAESIFYGALVFSPVFFAGLLFSRSFRDSSSAAADFGANLFGAMIGGVVEYLSLLTGYRFLLILVAGCYLLAMMLDRGRVSSSVAGRRRLRPHVAAD